MISWQRRRVVVVGLLILINAISFLICGVLLARLSSNLQRQDARTSALSSKLDTASQLARATQAKVAELKVAPPERQPEVLKQLTDLTESSKDVTSTTALEGKPGRPPTPEEIEAAITAFFVAHPELKGDTGPSPSAADISASVEDYLSVHPPVSPSDLLQSVTSAVGSYFNAHPELRGPAGPAGQSVTPEQIASAVLEYLVAHPVAAGTPSPEQIAAAVADYFVAHPELQGPMGPVGPVGPEGPIGATGATGATGAQGPGPTSEQVASAVSDYLTTHPLYCERQHGGTTLVCGTTPP